MAAIIEIETPPATPQVADPAPLGLAAFALTTFLLSGYNATFIPNGIWIGAALFYGGLIQLLAGMWEFRNRNVFGATAFSVVRRLLARPRLLHVPGRDLERLRQPARRAPTSTTRWPGS